MDPCGPQLQIGHQEVWGGRTQSFFMRLPGCWESESACKNYQCTWLFHGCLCWNESKLWPDLIIFLTPHNPASREACHVGIGFHIYPLIIYHRLSQINEAYQPRRRHADQNIYVIICVFIVNPPNFLLSRASQLRDAIEKTHFLH